MKKWLFPIFVLIIISLVACQQATKDTTGVAGNQVVTEAPKTGTSEPVIDNAVNGMDNVDSVEKDLSTDSLSDVDSGLQDIQNI